MSRYSSATWDSSPYFVGFHVSVGHSEEQVVPEEVKARKSISTMHSWPAIKSLSILIVMKSLVASSSKLFSSFSLSLSTTLTRSTSSPLLCDVMTSVAISTAILIETFPLHGLLPLYPHSTRHVANWLFPRAARSIHCLFLLIKITKFENFNCG